MIGLNRLAGDPVNLLVNGKPIARGEVVVVDEEFGLRVTEVVSDSGPLSGPRGSAAVEPAPVATAAPAEPTPRPVPEPVAEDEPAETAV